MVRSCSSLGAADERSRRAARPSWSPGPRRASSASACRSVIRLTPNHAARSCSVGSRSPGTSAPAAICSASQSSICACTVVPGPRTISGGCLVLVRSAGRTRRRPVLGCGCMLSPSRRPPVRPGGMKPAGPDLVPPVLSRPPGSRPRCPPPATEQGRLRRRHHRREVLAPPDGQVIDGPDQRDEDHHRPQDRDVVEPAEVRR